MPKSQATDGELELILKEIKKVDPSARFVGNGRYVSLTSTQGEWTEEQKRKINAIFAYHDWKVKV